MKLEKEPLYSQPYLDQGTGSTVVLLHGLFGNLLFWSKTIEVLKSSHRVVVPRLPIFRSESPDPIRISHLVKILDEFLEWNNLTEITLVGHGMGGQLALMYAYYFPSKVQKIVISGSHGLFDVPYISDTHEMEFNAEESELEIAYQSGGGSSKIATSIYRIAREIPQQFGIDSLLKVFGTEKGSTFLNRIDQPVLLLWGMEDSVTPPDIALHFYDFLHNSEVRLLEGCGHVPMTENPELFNHHLTSFLK